MKKWICILCCAALLAVLGCASAEEAAELSTATALKEYLPTVGQEDYTARDTDGDGFDDEIMISYNSGGKTESDTLEVYCQCLDGTARVVSFMYKVPEDADMLKVYEQINEFNRNLNLGRWIFDEDSRYVCYAQEIYMVDEASFGAYAYTYMDRAASYVYSFYERFAAAVE